MPERYYQAQSWEELNEVLTDISLRLGQLRPDGSIIYNVIGGWLVAGDSLYAQSSRGSTAHPYDGIVLDAADNAIYIYEGFYKRLAIGNLAPDLSTRNYGIKAWDSSGATGGVLFELSDHQQIIAGWTISSNSLGVSTNIILDSSNTAIYLAASTFGDKGIQLEWNTGSPRIYVGDGSSQYLQFDGTNLTWKAANSALDSSGNISLTGGSIGGWTIGANTLSNASVTLHSTGAIYVKGSTFTKAGMQFEYNDGTPQFYVGDGSSEYMKYSGGIVEISVDTSAGIIVQGGGGISVQEGGDISLYGSSDKIGGTTLTNPAFVQWIGDAGTTAEYYIRMGLETSGNRVAISASTPWGGFISHLRGFNVETKAIRPFYMITDRFYWLYGIVSSGSGANHDVVLAFDSCSSVMYNIVRSTKTEGQTSWGDEAIYDNFNSTQVAGGLNRRQFSANAMATGEVWNLTGSYWNAGFVRIIGMSTGGTQIAAHLGWTSGPPPNFFIFSSQNISIGTDTVGAVSIYGTTDTTSDIYLKNDLAGEKCKMIAEVTFA